MKLTKDMLRGLIVEALQEVDKEMTGTASDDVRSGMSSEPTPEEMGLTVYVVLEDRGVDGTTLFGVFDNAEKAKNIANGLGQDADVYSFNMNQLSKTGGIRLE